MKFYLKTVFKDTTPISGMYKAFYIGRMSDRTRKTINVTYAKDAAGKMEPIPGLLTLEQNTGTIRNSFLYLPSVVSEPKDNTHSSNH